MRVRRSYTPTSDPSPAPIYSRGVTRSLAAWTISPASRYYPRCTVTPLISPNTHCHSLFPGLSPFVLAVISSVYKELSPFVLAVISSVYKELSPFVLAVISCV